jgi:hypothetical protein
LTWSGVVAPAITDEQPTQAVLDRDLDVAPPALGTSGGAVAHVHALVAEFRRQHNLVAAAREDLAERDLRPPSLPYMSAVSSSVMPASTTARACWTSIRQPKSLQPSPTMETTSPELPRVGTVAAFGVF